jgi:hypothetical protein
LQRQQLAAQVLHAWIVVFDADAPDDRQRQDGLRSLGHIERLSSPMAIMYVVVSSSAAT